MPEAEGQGEADAVAVVGGTGLIGRLVVAELTRRGLRPVVIARSTGVDLITGHGLEAALTGCAAAIDVSNVVTTRRRTAMRFFETAAGNLARAARSVGVKHLIALSIVGSDRVNFGYYLGKRAQEQQIREGGVPWTILRATQFFEFPQPLLQGRSPVVIVPDMFSRPVAAREVAEVLAAAVQRPALNQVIEVAGPREERMVKLARRLAARAPGRKLVVPLRLPGTVGAQMAGGGLLPAGEYIRTALTFDEWLVPGGQ